MSRTRFSTQSSGPLHLLSQSMPGWLAALFLGRPRARTLSFGEGDVLIRRRGHWTAPAAWLDPQATPQNHAARGFVDVALPAARVLRRDVQLPPTPRRMIERAVTLDMLRRTPFKADETYAAFADVKTGSDGMRVTHWVARRNDIDALRARLATAGLKTRSVSVDGAVLADFTAQTYPIGRLWRAINAAAILLIFGTAAWIWAEPALSAKQALPAQEAELQRLTQEAVALRQAIDAQDGAQSERNAFLKQMTGRTPMVTALRHATVMLPDTVWITDMAIDRNRVVIRGSTAGSAAQMLLDLPANRVLRDPRLAGPVSQTADGRERFEIVFQTPHGAS